MEQILHTFDAEHPVAILGNDAEGDVLLLCEHASNKIPAALDHLGVSEDVQNSHVAWDPGALGVAKELLTPLKAQLIYSTISRLAYDCNRPPHAPSAIPAQSEIYAIPGNQNLTPAQRRERVDKIYTPFRETVEACLRTRAISYIVTIHSFTPIYHGKTREVEIGILHGKDPRLAAAMMSAVPPHWPYVTQLNEPYSAKDGVAHSLDLYGGQFEIPNVMIEIRNDLIQTHEQQAQMATHLAPWIAHCAKSVLKDQGDVA